MIGASAKVLGNIVIGENSKIGAGAIVLNDIPKNVTAVGVPAKVVKTNDISFDKERINEIIKLFIKSYCIFFMLCYNIFTLTNLPSVNS